MEIKVDVEVILCTYNGEKYILEQLESIDIQTYPVSLISIYDDCSSDNTIKYIYKYINSLSSECKYKVKVTINKENIGYAKNFSQGILSSESEILVFCDQDDIWLPNKVNLLVNEINKTNVDLVFSDGYLIDSFGNKYTKKTVLNSYGLIGEEEKFSCQPFNYLIKKNYINGASIAVKRDLAINSLPLPDEIPHDYWLALFACFRNGIRCCPQSLYKYRQHSNNAIGIGRTKFIRKYYNLWKFCKLSRDRELRITRNIFLRFNEYFPDDNKTNKLYKKYVWLEYLLMSNSSYIKKLSRIIVSKVKGDYKKYSPEYSFIRDILSLHK